MCKYLRVRGKMEPKNKKLQKNKKKVFFHLTIDLTQENLN